MVRRNSCMRALSLLFWALFLVAQTYTADAQTAQQIAKKAFESTVLLVMEEASGQPVSLGSGFFVAQGKIASNLHVVKGASRGYARVIGQKAKYIIEGIIGIDPDRDLVLLKISGTITPPLPIGNSDSVEVGESVYAVGNPRGLEGTFSQGIVSGIREVDSNKLLQITAPISPGNSGGPVLNSKGEVIGVSVATFMGGQNLNFAIPSNYIKVLISNAGEIRPLVSTRAPGKQRSILANLGGRSSEGVTGENFTYDGSNLPTGEYSFSLVNKLREPVQQIYCLVVFYDVQGNPIDVAKTGFSGILVGGLAKRVKGRVDKSVENLNNPTPASPYFPNPPRRPKGKIEIRILDFKIAQ